MTQTHTQQLDATERIIKQLQHHRDTQRRLFPNKENDSLVNGELIDAAMCYARLAKQQERTRSFDEVKPRQRADGSLANGYVPSGGSDTGYKLRPEETTPPDDWPFTGTWNPSYPRYNLIRAATLIVAELERLERMDAELMRAPEVKKPKRKQEAYTLDIYEDATDTLSGWAYNNVGGGVTTATTATFKAATPGHTGIYIGNQPITAGTNGVLSLGPSSQSLQSGTI